jgi:hypothetical protein
MQSLAQGGSSPDRLFSSGSLTALRFFKAKSISSPYQSSPYQSGPYQSGPYQSGHRQKPADSTRNVNCHLTRTDRRTLRALVKDKTNPAPPDLNDMHYKNHLIGQDRPDKIRPALLHQSFQHISIAATVVF